MKNMIRCLVMLLAVGLFGGNVRGDKLKSYAITLSSTYRIGETEFQPGNYRIVVDASKVRFTQVGSDKAAVEVDAKVESTDSKFDRTAVHSKQVDGVNHISEITLGGSKTKLAFE